MEPSHEVTARKNPTPPVKASLLSPLETSPRKLNTRLRARPKSMVALERAEECEAEDYLNENSDHLQVRFDQTLPKGQSMSTLYRQRKTPPKRSPSSNVKMAPVSEKRHFKSEADLSSRKNNNNRSVKQSHRKKKQHQTRRLSENSNFYPSDMEIDEDILLDSESEWFVIVLSRFGWLL